MSARPFVFLNMSMTADGKIASAGRTITSFGSRRDLQHLYELRATADAVMCGARTVEETNARLGPGGVRFRRLRLRRGLAEYNLRIIVSGSGSIDPGAPIFRARFSPVVILTTSRAGARRLKVLRSLADEVVVCGRTRLDLAGALEQLRKRWKVKRLLCEGGGALNDALFQAGLVDELHLTLCPLILGGGNAPTIADGAGVRRLADAWPLRLLGMSRVGSELFLVLRSRRSSSPGPSRPSSVGVL